MSEYLANGGQAHGDDEFELATFEYELSPFAEAVGVFDTQRHALYDHAVDMIHSAEDNFAAKKDALYDKVINTAESFQEASYAALKESGSTQEALNLIATLYAGDEEERIERLKRHKPHATYRKIGIDNATVMLNLYLTEPQLGYNALKNRYAIDVAHNLQSCIREPLYSAQELRQREKQLKDAKRHHRVRRIGQICLCVGLLSAGAYVSYRAFRHTPS